MPPRFNIMPAGEINNQTEVSTPNQDVKMTGLSKE